MSRYAPNEAHLTYLASVLCEGGIVAVPSETVYGLAADATNPTACEAIFALKRRPLFDPLIVHVDDLDQARQYAVFSLVATHLAERFWPGPLTLVLPRLSPIPDIVTAGRPTVAVRAPQHPVLRALLKKVGRGLAAPSANPFGYISPTTAEHVEHSFGEELAHILDGGPCEIGVESTILDASSPNRIIVLRHGGIPTEAIRAALQPLPGPPELVVEHSATVPTAEQPAQAPGLLKRHYSPHKPVQLFAHGNLPDPRENEHVAHLAYCLADDRRGCANAFSLTRNGDSREAAAQLYARLRQLDSRHWEAISIELPPADAEFADALTDRLQRAASRE